MSLEKTIERLGREVNRDPKKAGALGVMLLVAVYFWAPLVSGWLGTGRPPDVPPTPAPAANAAAATPATANADNPGTKKETSATPTGWQALIAWMDEDPRRLPAEAPAARDPFHPPVKAEPAGEKVAEKPEVKIEAKSLDQVGLVLSSTLVGPRSSLARINGKTYRPGQAVRVQYQGERVAFQIQEIHPRRVVLEREGERFELKSGRPDPREDAGSDNDP